ncbi:hypothetical protein PUP68_11845 [Pseudomonas chlororaphis]|uniref:hypothetical protein n=1 Tax=Pseudomonas chlororaphis TaxID=587753 RepID=UPI002368B880|nr:hypothetical protein [Pseudomonas chlororaphis]WDG79184.1 hypothetical protein PUP77_00395 [Pseudomonas chlororaphis]WDG87764.1 hypothetical protein PUP68_11845 [Pseudomonas chlororaphis]
MSARAKLVYGVGINDANYDVTRYELLNGKRTQVWICPFYSRWASMIQRCYYPPCQLKHPTYLGCSVFEGWHVFSTFKSWMEVQDWHGKELDKDLLSKGNKIYGPETCCFLNRIINSLVRERYIHMGGLPAGVAFYKDRGKFRSRAHCVFTGKKNHLGYFETPHEAHAAWLEFKITQAKTLAAQQTDNRVAKALVCLYESYGAQNV